MKTATTPRKKPVRRTAVQRFEALQQEALEVQLMCMKADEQEYAEACVQVGNTVRDAMAMRAAQSESPTNFETQSTGGPPS